MSEQLLSCIHSFSNPIPASPQSLCQTFPNLYSLAIKEMFGRLLQRASFSSIRDNKMVDHSPTEETIGLFAETAKSIIPAVCAERFDPTPSYQTCRFCDYADLCGMKETGGGERMKGREENSVCAVSPRSQRNTIKKTCRYHEIPGRSNLLPEIHAIPMTYTVSLISTEENETLSQRYLPKVRYEIKSEIYGCCIKLLCEDHTLRDTWEDNFYSMSQNVRSHGRLFVCNDPSYQPDIVLFDPHAKTAYLLNVRYYGWIKSIAISLAGDILEDEHGIWSVHGACVDIEGKGVCLIGAPGSGKTTQTYGLLTNPRTRVISDDWFFFRVYGEDILAYGSEKNFYIQEDLATIWKEFGGLVPDNTYDPDGRAVADVRWVIGKGRILPLTTIKTLIVLKRDTADPNKAQSLDPETAMKLFGKNNYFNPHLLVHNSFKTNMRDRYIGDLLGRTQCYCVNTTGTPEETQKLIRSLAGVKQVL